MVRGFASSASFRGSAKFEEEFLVTESSLDRNGFAVPIKDRFQNPDSLSHLNQIK